MTNESIPASESTPTVVASVGRRPQRLGDVLRGLQAKCTNAVELSLDGANENVLGESYVFASDLEAWRNAINESPEAGLLATAATEYVVAMLNVCQGQYRNGFKGLRLVLELCLQSTYLSANLLLREEWIRGEKDTVWATLMDEENGPLSLRFCKAFFPELGGHTGHFRELARTIYRELSECIHGNVPNHIPLPSKLDFSQETFNLWHKKAEIVRLVVQFAFSVRYLRNLPADKRREIEPVLIEQLGHISAIRTECSTNG